MSLDGDYEPYAELRLTKGYKAIVDPDDWLWLSQWKWHALINKKKTGLYVYAVRSERRNGKAVLLHREIMGATGKQRVDHRNHNTLDNRRSNLRLATNSQNMANRRVVWNQYGYKGIKYAGGPHPWTGSVVRDGIKHSIGYHDTPELAAAAYDQLAIKLHGEFAKTNEDIFLPRSSS